MIESRTLIRVRYAETDLMGFAYHGNYFAWLEQSRVEMMENLGLPYPEIEAMGYFMPVLEANCRYKRPAHFDDRVHITASIHEPPTAQLRIEYTVECKETLLAEAFTRHAFIDKAGRPVKPPEPFRELIQSTLAKSG